MLPVAGRAVGTVFGLSTRAPAAGAVTGAADSGVAGVIPAGKAQPLPPLRQEYIDKVRALAGKAEQMRADGHSAEEIARTLSADRRVLGDDESDNALRRAFRDVTREMDAKLLDQNWVVAGGAKTRNEKWGVAGSIELETVTLELRGTTVVLESETHSGLSITGDEHDVDDIAERIA